MRSTQAELSECHRPASLDMWLSFDAFTNEQYERENGAARAAHLSRTILVGLIFYNMYNFTGALLMPDITPQSVALRLLVVTPLSIGLAYIVLILGVRQREWIVTIGCVNAYAVPVFLFWLSDHPWAAYSFGEFSLTLAFGNMFLALRFRQALVFTFCAFAITLFGLMMHRTLDPALNQAFLLQAVTAGFFTLYGNYLIEKRRCTDYVIARNALMRANKAELSQLRLTELSRTDALTGLPNRRYLDETLGAWLDGASSVAVLMVDLDYFKLYNDSLGHPAGDDCLRQVSQAFLEETQTEDSFCARFGGEEFTIVFRNLAEFEAIQRTHQLVQVVAALKIAHPGRHDGLDMVTISIGLNLVSPGEPADKNIVLSNADTALYEAKKNGRNGYVAFRQGKDPYEAKTQVAS